MSHGPEERTTSAGNAENAVAQQNAGANVQMFDLESPSLVATS